ncbi:hypothetical protein N0V82_003149 [Gnomoniopsis sp. IMI 355080]|nr:hypothetical protein N0V82_003149 [Gnomoniopsis sp. IMI 355080]
MKTAVALVSLVAAGGQSFVIPADDALILTKASSSACANVTCVPSSGGAHIIISRASTEAAGTGVLGYVSDAIVSACPSSDVAANPYPALLDPYLPSETAGVGNLTEMVISYQACCPDSQIVLMGYSQGAQVTADFLCGRSSSGFPPTPPYASLVADSVSAVVLMGDPSFVKGQSWDRGNASNVSYFPRLDNAACEPVAQQFISYCDSGDYFCDNGTSADALAIHEGYVQEYGSEAATYVIEHIDGCSGL